MEEEREGGSDKGEGEEEEKVYEEQWGRGRWRGLRGRWNRKGNRRWEWEEEGGQEVEEEKEEEEGREWEELRGTRRGARMR